MAAMAAPAKSGTGLQIIFSFFLGLMVTAFIGVGVYTFYPPPETRTQRQIEMLNREMEDVQGFKEASAITDADRAKLRRIQDDMRRLQDKQQAEQRGRAAIRAVILIAFATLVMAVSIIRADQLPVISNGLLLGGVFTMVYGVGWIIATGTSIVRFIVMTIALAITLTLGYIRFVRTKDARAEQADSGQAELWCRTATSQASSCGSKHSSGASEPLRRRSSRRSESRQQRGAARL